jgi:hypothetical protein
MCAAAGAASTERRERRSILEYQTKECERSDSICGLRSGQPSTNTAKQQAQLKKTRGLRRCDSHIDLPDTFDDECHWHCPS